MPSFWGGAGSPCSTKSPGPRHTSVPSEQMGLKGTALTEFIREQQDLDREERNQQRELDKIQQDKDDKFRLAQMEREREKE